MKGRDVYFFLSLSLSLSLSSLLFLLFLFFFHQDEYVPIDANRIGRIMLLRRQNEVSRSSPSTGVLVFYVKIEQFYSTSSSTYTLLFSPHVFFFLCLFLSLPICFSLLISLSFSFRDLLSYRRCHKFHPRYPSLCFALLLAHIFRYPRTQPCSRNPFRSTPAVTLAHPPYTYIANSDIATASCIYRYIWQLYLRVRHIEQIRLSVSSPF